MWAIYGTILSYNNFTTFSRNNKKKGQRDATITQHELPKNKDQRSVHNEVYRNDNVFMLYTDIFYLKKAVYQIIIHENLGKSVHTPNRTESGRNLEAFITKNTQTTVKYDMGTTRDRVLLLRK